MRNLTWPGWAGIRGDIVGGTTAAIVTLPPIMGIGVIAFAPLGSDYVSLGLIAVLMGSTVLTIWASLFGGVPGLISSPRASVCLVFASIVTGFLAADTIFAPGVDKSAVALSLGMMTIILGGLVQFGFGAFRIGDIIRYVPFPVIAGFLNAAAILIIISQIRVVLQLPAEAYLVEAWQYFDAGTLARIGLVGLTVLAIVYLPRAIPWVPGLISGGAFGVGAYFVVLAFEAGVDLGRTMPPIPNLTLDAGPLEDLFGLVSAAWQGGEGDGVTYGGIRLGADGWLTLLAIMIPGAISIAFLQSLDGLFSAVAFEELTQNPFNARRELMAQGIGTILCGSFSYLSGSASIGRTLPSYNAGGRTAWAGIVCSIVTLAAILALAPVVGRIPEIVVAAVLFVLAVGIVDRWSLSLLRNLVRNRFETKRSVVADLAIVCLVVGSAIVFGLVVAVGVGIALAILEFVMGIGRSPIRRSYRGDAVSSYLQRGNFSASLLQRYGDRIAIAELEGPFFFGSAGKIEAEVDRLASDGACHIILDMRRVNSVDSTASRALVRLSKRLARQGKTLSVSYVMPEQGSEERADPDEDGPAYNSYFHQNWDQLLNLGALGEIGREHFFPDTDTAMRHCEMLLVEELDRDGADTVPAWPGMTGLLDELDASEMEAIRSYSEERAYPAGTTIFRQGDAGEALYIILDGMVDAMVHQDATGREIRVNTMTGGAVFGEMAILDPQPRSATVVAVEDTTCLRISAEQLETLNARNPSLGLRVMKYMCLLFTSRLRMANLAIIELES